MNSEFRNTALDGIRGLAIVSVLLHHLMVIIPTGTTSALIYLLVQAGWIGVDLFFVLSGFLITNVLIRARNEPHYARNFYARRVLRIFPVYYAALFGMLIFYMISMSFNTVHMGSEPVEQALTDMPWNFLFLTNALIWSKGHFLASLNHFWTLAVEEQFYLLWPLAVYFIAPKRLTLFCGGVAVAAMALRVTLLAHAAPAVGVASFTLCRMDSLAIGAMVASALQSESAKAHARRFAGPIFFLFLIVLVRLSWLQGALYSTDPGTQKFGYTVLACMFGALVSLGYSVPREGMVYRILSLPPLTFFGKISFALYVVHFPIQAILEGIWSTAEASDALSSPIWGVIVHTLLSGTVSVLLACLSWNFLETPMMKLKRGFENAPRSPNLRVEVPA